MSITVTHHEGHGAVTTTHNGNVTATVASERFHGAKDHLLIHNKDTDKFVAMYREGTWLSVVNVEDESKKLKDGGENEAASRKLLFNTLYGLSRKRQEVADRSRAGRLYTDAYNDALLAVSNSILSGEYKDTDSLTNSEDVHIKMRIDSWKRRILDAITVEMSTCDYDARGQTRRNGLKAAYRIVADTL